MDQVFAHGTVYPHMHPHPETASGMDMGLTVLFALGLAVVLRGVWVLARRSKSQSKEL